MLRNTDKFAFCLPVLVSLIPYDNNSLVVVLSDIRTSVWYKKRRWEVGIFVVLYVVGMTMCNLGLSKHYDTLE